MIIFTGNDLAKALVVSVAVSKDKLRPALNVIYIKDNIIYASDAHRLHFADLSGEYTDGAYVIIKKGKKELILAPSTAINLDQMPDFSQVTPKDSVGPLTLGYDKYVDYGIIVKALEEDRYLNYDYFVDAQAAAVHLNTDKNGPIKFTGLITAIVMPLRNGDATK